MASSDKLQPEWDVSLPPRRRSGDEGAKAWQDRESCLDRRPWPQFVVFSCLLRGEGWDYRVDPQVVPRIGRIQHQRERHRTQPDIDGAHSPSLEPRVSRGTIRRDRAYTVDTRG